MRLNKPEFTPAQLRRIIQVELAFHPRARYADIYKLINQAFYGPTHITPDPTAITDGIRTELSAVPKSRRKAWQDIGGAFIRLDLSVLKGSGVNDYPPELQDDLAMLLTEIILASRLDDPLSMRDWPSVWQNIPPLAGEFITPLKAETALIAECLETGVMPSHSDIYRELYAPHYRVIHHSHYHKLPTLNKELL